jgi:hypothetical protein
VQLTVSGFIMGTCIKKAITRLAVFAYGLFTVFLCGCLSITGGTFFKKHTDRQNLELQLGKSLIFEQSLCILFGSRTIFTYETFLLIVVDP